MEKEADVLGAKALQAKFITPDSSPKQLAISSSNQPLQFAPPAQEDEPWAFSEFLGSAAESAGAATSEFLGEGAGQILNYFQLINAVDTVEENEDVSGFFFDLLNLITLEDSNPDVEGASGSTSLEEAEEDPSSAEESGEVSTDSAAVEATEEETIEIIEETHNLYNKYTSMAGGKASLAADYASNTFGNGVVSNLQGMVETPDTAAKIVTDLSKKLNFSGPDVYTYLTTQDPGLNKLRDFVASEAFGEANKYIAVFAILRDAKDLVSLIKKKMANKENLSEEEKNSVNSLVDTNMKTKALDLIQGTAYGAESVLGVTEVMGNAVAAGGVAAGVGTAATAVPGLGLAASGIEFIRGAWKSKKAHDRVVRLNEIIKEINLMPDDAAPGFAEFKSKMTPLIKRVQNRIFRNGVRSGGGGAAVAGGVAVAGFGAATAGVGLGIAAAVAGTYLGGKMLWGKVRAKKEKRKELAEYLYKTSLKDDYTGSFAKKIVKAIIGKEEYMGLNEKDLTGLIAEKIKSN